MNEASLPARLSAREHIDRSPARMSLTPCSACNRRMPGKLAHCTAAWWTAENVRLAFRLKLCAGCYAERIAPLEVASEEFSLSCPACHIDASDNMDPIYITAFIPGHGQRVLEMPMCPACAAILRVWAVDHGQLLPDRQVESVGFGPQTDTPSAWDELGLGRRG